MPHAGASLIAGGRGATLSVFLPMRYQIKPDPSEGRDPALLQQTLLQQGLAIQSLKKLLHVVAQGFQVIAAFLHG